MSKMITIVGPTASGKSALAMELALKYNGQIICADSRTIYRGMDIGTSKPTPADQRQVKHYLIDIIDPNQKYSAAQFKQEAFKAISQIRHTGCVPFMVGGSGMYIDSVLYDYQFRKTDRDVDLATLSDTQLVDLATKLYPEHKNKLEIKNRRRIEQFINRGPSQNGDRRQQRIESLVIGINKNKLTLKQDIEERTEYILSTGFVQEVEALIAKYGDTAIGLQSTGYRAVIDSLEGRLDPDKLSQQIVADTLKLAKKQITWFKRNNMIKWVDSVEEAERLVQEYLAD